MFSRIHRLESHSKTIIAAQPRNDNTCFNKCQTAYRELMLCKLEDTFCDQEFEMWRRCMEVCKENSKEKQ